MHMRHGRPLEDSTNAATIASECIYDPSRTAATIPLEDCGY